MFRWLCVLLAVLVLLGSPPAAELVSAQTSGPPPVSLSALIDQTLAVFPDVQADVVEAQGRLLTLSAGRRSGATTGLSLEVYREGREIRHPRTGQVLGRTEQALGRAVVTQVLDGYSLATFEGKDVSVGDRARTATGKVKLTLLSFTGAGVKENLVEAATNEIYEGLARSGRFSVTLGDQIALALRQQGVTPEEFLAGRGVAEALQQSKAENVLALHYRQVERRPFIEARLFTAGRREPAIATGLFVPSSVKAVQPGRFSGADRFQRETPEKKPRSLLARLLGGDLESDRYSSAQTSIPLKEIGRFGFAAVAMDAAIAPADRIPRVALSDGNRIWVYKVVNQALEADWSYLVRSRGTVFSVQLADLLGDGRLQVVVNRYDPRLGLNSMIAGVQDGKPRALVDQLDLALLAVDEKGTGVKQTLWVQPRNLETFFAKGNVERMEFRDGKLVTRDRVVVPSDFRATGAALSTVTGKDQRTLAYVDEYNRLRIVNGTEETWRSTSPVGGGLPPIEIERLIERGGRSYFYQPEPIPLAIDLDGDGVQELVVPQNQVEGMLGIIYRGPAGVRFQQLNSGFEGRIVAVAGYSTHEGGSPTVIAAVLRSRGFAQGSDTQIIMTLSDE